MKIIWVGKVGYRVTAKYCTLSIVVWTIVLLTLMPFANAQTSSSGGSWRGPWLGTNTYVVNDLVSYNGSIYINTVATAPTTTSTTSPGTNQFDINAVVQSVVIIAGDGTTAGIGGFESTGYVNVAGASSFITNMTPNLFSPYGVAFYNSSKVYISGFTDQNVPAGYSLANNALTANQPISVPSGAAFVRFWYSNSTEGTTDVAAIIDMGSTLQSSYTSYGSGTTTTTTTPAASPADMTHWSSLSGSGSSSGSTLPSDLVYTDAPQTITGFKNFTGNVGIGTTTPGASLEVNGSVKLSSGSNGSLIFADGTTQSNGFPMGKGFQDTNPGFGPSGLLAGNTTNSGLIFNQHYGFGPFTGPHSIKIATLAVSGPGTYDRLHFVATLNQTFCGACNTYYDIVLGNRNGFAYQYTSHGAGPTGAVRIAAYSKPDGTVDVYLMFGVDFVSAIYTVLENYQETIYLSPPDSNTTTPPGTLVFDTSSPNYPPSIFTDYAKNVTVGGNLRLSSSAGGSITYGDQTVQMTAWNGVLQGGDYAESVDVEGPRSTFEPGDVMTIDPGHPGLFLASSTPFSRLVAGVYSTKPGVRGRRQSGDLLQSKTEVPMAMIGIVPTKVSAENGPIAVGDLLVSSSTRGYAMRAGDGTIPAGCVIGKAIGSLSSGSGLIEVLISLQ